MKNLKAMLSIKFKSTFAEDELINLFQQDLEDFTNVQGLLQKYYISEEITGAMGGLYIFESKRARLAFWNSALAKSIPAKYGVIPNTIRVEQFDIPILLNESVLA